MQVVVQSKSRHTHGKHKNNRTLFFIGIAIFANFLIAGVFIGKLLAGEYDSTPDAIGAPSSVRREAEEAYVSLQGTRYEHVYYRANPNGCGLRFDDGVSAGPVLKACGVSGGDGAPVAANCNPTEELHNLDVIKSLTSGESGQFFLPHQPRGVDDKWAVDRIRRSSATGIVFIDEKYLVTGQYGTRTVFLYEYSFARDDGEGRNILTTTLLDSADTIGYLDLLDYDGRRNLIIGSIFNRGAQEIFKLDLKEKRIRQYKDVYAFGRNEWCHDTAFFPYSSNGAHILAAGSNKGRYSETSRIRWQILMNLDPEPPKKGEWLSTSSGTPSYSKY